jgi:hypothetical protein
LQSHRLAVARRAWHLDVVYATPEPLPDRDVSSTTRCLQHRSDEPARRAILILCRTSVRRLSSRAASAPAPPSWLLLVAPKTPRLLVTNFWMRASSTPNGKLKVGTPCLLSTGPPGESGASAHRRTRWRRVRSARPNHRNVTFIDVGIRTDVPRVPCVDEPCRRACAPTASQMAAQDRRTICSPGLQIRTPAT